MKRRFIEYIFQHSDLLHPIVYADRSWRFLPNPFSHYVFRSFFLHGILSHLHICIQSTDIYVDRSYEVAAWLVSLSPRSRIIHHNVVRNNWKVSKSLVYHYGFKKVLKKNDIVFLFLFNLYCNQIGTSYIIKTNNFNQNTKGFRTEIPIHRWCIDFKTKVFCVNFVGKTKVRETYLP